MQDTLSKSPRTPRVEVRETIDGIPADDYLAAAEAHTRSSRRASSAAASKSKAAAPPDVRKADPYIWGIYICLLAISAVELFSASSFEVTSNNIYGPLIRHLIFLGGGLGIVLWFQKMRYIVFRRWARVGALAALGLLLFATFGGGEEINGAERAIRIAGLTIQPAEIVKLAIVVLLAQILATNQIPHGVSNKGVILSAVVVIVFSAITWKNGLTNTVIVMAVSLCMFLIGGMEFRKFAVVFGIYMACAGVLGLMKYQDDKTSFKAETETVAAADRAETHKGRLTRFLEGVHPNDTINDMNRQAMMSHFALAHGGLIGQGPGNSRESARLPLAFSDYIYSIVVEDIGFVGGVILLILFLCLIGRAGRIASRCGRAFPALLIMGCAVLIVLQALVHMAIVVGIVPVSGQPLPFISKGGTSVLIMSMAIGMMLSVSRYGISDPRKKPTKKELEELPPDMQAENPTYIPSDS